MGDGTSNDGTESDGGDTAGGTNSNDTDNGGDSSGGDSTGGDGSEDDSNDTGPGEESKLFVGRKLNPAKILDETLDEKIVLVRLLRNVKSVKETITTLELVKTKNEDATETGAEEVSSAELIQAILDVAETSSDVFSEQIQIKTKILVKKVSMTFTKLSVSQIEQVEATRMECLAVQENVEAEIVKEKKKIEAATGTPVEESKFQNIDKDVEKDVFIVDMVSLQRNKDAVVTGIEAVTNIIQQFSVEPETEDETACETLIKLSEDLLKLIDGNDEAVQDKSADLLSKVGAKVTGCSEENKETLKSVKTSFESKKFDIEVRIAIIEEDISFISETSINDNVGLEELGIATVAPDGSAVAKDSLSLSVSDETETLIVVDIIQIEKKIDAIEKSMKKIDEVMTVSTTEVTAISSEKFERLVIKFLDLLSSAKIDEEAEDIQKVAITLISSTVEVLSEEVKTSLTTYKE